MPKVPRDLRRWAQDKEEQEEFLSDPTLVRLREALHKDVQDQRHRLMGKCRTGSLEDIRYETGFLTSLEDILRDLEPSDE